MQIDERQPMDGDDEDDDAGGQLCSPAKWFDRVSH